MVDLTEAQVLRDVEEFAQEFELNDILPDLRKGALIARDPDNFRTVAGITPEETEVIHNEVAHKWRQPRALYFSIILCSIGAAVQ